LQEVEPERNIEREIHDKRRLTRLLRTSIG
jgi:hypothetical protein